MSTKSGFQVLYQPGENVLACKRCTYGEDSQFTYGAEAKAFYCCCTRIIWNSRISEQRFGPLGSNWVNFGYSKWVSYYWAMYLGMVG
ncbi:hypothetical protein E1A91_D07G222600v1 [Gossypium mustelinum]|uniref:Uncharacterized protein n=1 Tax=Gossypium mustelinum TaxID=34275 RepID=A0A5D2UCB0_GOSMU|nr:hypothetical protein E1A91_D07G222600v1 [Gossypium mustelinum]